jgi:Family of unknown function (DUF5321)
MANYGAFSAQALRYSPVKGVRQCRINSGMFLHNRGVSTDSPTLPRLAQPSMWRSIVPRALRTRSENASEPNQKKIPNPASYFIWIYVLIGSQAVHILQVQNDFSTFMRKAELKIGKLHEVVEALQRGEEIDVEKVLGTGDETQELEWEEALKEIENEDRVWQTNRQKRREAKERAKEEAARDAKEDTASPVNQSVHQDAEVEGKESIGQDDRPRAPGFY